jgi:hypothetical protein
MRRAAALSKTRTSSVKRALLAVWVSGNFAPLKWFTARECTPRHAYVSFASYVSGAPSSAPFVSDTPSSEKFSAEVSTTAASLNVTVYFTCP